MMKKYTILISLVLMAFLSRGADPDYSVSAIPANLLKKANVVKRIDQTEFKIINPTSTIYTRHYAYTILNEKGEGFGEFAEGYDKLRKITLLEGALYDAGGKRLKKIKNKDFTDVSAVDDISLIDDSRVKTHKFYRNEYPYTVEYFVEVSFNNTFIFPAWMPQESEKMSVAESNYTLSFPATYNVRFKEFNFQGTPQTSLENGFKKMEWKIKDLLAFEIPFQSGSLRDLVPVVYFSPTDFELEGYKGDMKSWSDYGKFLWTLNKERDILPAIITQKVNALTSGMSDKKEKIKALYQYFQNNTRYISIQLGIGGWQPFSATNVAKNGYGDCKALSNYMYSLLKAADITSYYTIVNAGDSYQAQTRVMDDFPSNQFNHVILCVPLEKDTVWLECTSQQLPAGYVSSFTSNRKALMVKDNNGDLVSTPKYGYNENEQLRKIDASIDADGNLKMKVNTIFKAEQQDNLFSLLSNYSSEKVKERLQKSFALPTYTVNEVDHKIIKGMLPSITQQLDISSDNYATVTGKRMFITPNILNRSNAEFEEDENRKTDIVFRYAYRDIDDIQIEIPGGYHIESISKDIALKSKYGNYNVTCKVEGNKIVYHRLREQFTGKFPASEQKEIIAFYNEIRKNDRRDIILVKNE